MSFCMAWHDSARRGTAGRGWAGRGVAGQGKGCFQRRAGNRSPVQIVSMLGRAWLGAAWRGGARQGKGCFQRKGFALSDANRKHGGLR